MKNNNFKLPKSGIWILKKIADGKLDYGFFGDIQEVYNKTGEKKGVLRAKIWFWVHLFKILIPYIFNNIFWGFVMFRNYLKIAFRVMNRQKGYSFINIAGLAVGLSCSILILLYVNYELSYDTYHKNVNDIYRVAVEDKTFKWSESNFWNSTPVPLKNAIVKDFPEVLSATRINRRQLIIKCGNQVFSEDRFYMADQEFLDIFSFPLIKGNAKTALKEPFSVILTEETADKYFGKEDPLGEILTINNRTNYEVTGVLKNIPENSHFKFDFLASYNTYFSVRREGWGKNWDSIQTKTYLLLSKDANPEKLEEKLPAFLRKYDENTEMILHLEPLKSIHLYGNLNKEFEPNSDIRYVYIFSLTAFLIMLIACFNYINLSTARSEKRAREVGIRKVVGADRLNLIRQFFGESLVFSLMALLISLLLIKVLLPVFSSFVERDLNFSLFSDYIFLMGLFFLTVFVAIISGGYPALFLSSFQPVKVLKGGSSSDKKRHFNFRNTLVVVQFVISLILTACTLIIFNQLNFIKNKKLGFEKDQIVSIRLPDSPDEQYLTSFKNELTRYSHISDICVLQELPNAITNIGDARWEGMTGDENIDAYRTFVDYNYLRFFDIKLLHGRDFSREIITDPEESIILNKAAVDAIGWENPIGKKFGIWGDDCTVIGVVDNFHFFSLHLNIAPLAISLITPQMNYRANYLSVKINPADIPGTLAYIEEKFKQFSPGYPFEYSFLDERIDNMYRSEKKLGQTFIYFTLIAIFIACLGLFGLASFTAERRTKEIGIRKVMGASVKNLILMLSGEFVKWVVISSVIAFPVSWYAMNKWLSNFAYRVHIGMGTFGLAMVISLLIAVFTVSYQSFKAAGANPVDSLRNE